MNNHQLLLMSLMLTVFNADAASFDCNKACTYVEKEICGNELLSKLDEILADNYKNMRAADIGDGAEKDLRESQKKWLIQRNGCTTSECIKKAYLARIDAICAYPVLSGIYPVCIAADEIYK